MRLVCACGVIATTSISKQRLNLSLSPAARALQCVTVSHLKVRKGQLTKKTPKLTGILQKLVGKQPDNTKRKLAFFLKRLLHFVPDAPTLCAFVALKIAQNHFNKSEHIKLNGGSSINQHIEGLGRRVCHQTAAMFTVFPQTKSQHAHGQHELTII